MKDCDALFGKIMHATDPRVCRRCRRWGGVELAHIIPRGKSWRLRCNPSNTAWLCNLCHQGPRGVDRNGWSWSELIGEPTYEALRVLARDEGPRPHDWFRSERSRLRELWKETA